MKTANIFKTHKVGDVVRLQGALWVVASVVGSLDCFAGGAGVRVVELLPSNSERSTSEIEYLNEYKQNARP